MKHYQTMLFCLTDGAALQHPGRAPSLRVRLRHPTLRYKVRHPKTCSSTVKFKNKFIHIYLDSSTDDSQCWPHKISLVKELRLFLIAREGEAE
jgi:hypothetical protein